MLLVDDDDPGIRDGRQNGHPRPDDDPRLAARGCVATRRPAPLRRGRCGGVAASTPRSCRSRSTSGVGERDLGHQHERRTTAPQRLGDRGRVDGRLAAGCLALEEDGRVAGARASASPACRRPLPGPASGMLPEGSLPGPSAAGGRTERLERAALDASAVDRSTSPRRARLVTAPDAVALGEARRGDRAVGVTGSEFREQCALARPERRPFWLPLGRERGQRPPGPRRSGAPSAFEARLSTRRPDPPLRARSTPSARSARSRRSSVARLRLGAARRRRCPSSPARRASLSTGVVVGHEPKVHLRPDPASSPRSGPSHRATSSTRSSRPGGSIARTTMPGGAR